MLEGIEFGVECGALVAYCEGLAEVIDEHPERASLWREYRPALEMLVRLAEVEDDDGSAALLELVRAPVFAPVGYRTDGETDVGAGGGSDRHPVTHSVDAVAAAGRQRRSRTAP